MSTIQVVPEKRVRVLPADVYDTLELTALAFGGIGLWRDFDYLPDGAVLGYLPDGAVLPLGCPVCVHGLAQFAEGSAVTVSAALMDAGIRRSDNDNAVVKIVRRRDVGLSELSGDERVTFKQWAKELGVVRGES